MIYDRGTDQMEYWEESHDKSLEILPSHIDCDSIDTAEECICPNYFIKQFILTNSHR